MITQDVQTLDAGEKVELFDLDLTSFGGPMLRYHGYTQQQSIYWQGNAYFPWAINVEGFGKTGSGQQPTPSLQIGNIGAGSDGNPIPGVITSLCIYYNDLLGAKLTRHVTFGKYLDEENFTDGNPSADPTQEFPPELWYIEQKTKENNDIVEFQLVSALDLQGLQLPRRQIIPNSCSWIRIGGYRGPYCNYTGANMFNINDIPVPDISQDVCSGRLNSCKLRFGEYQVINFGGFPAAQLIK